MEFKLEAMGCLHRRCPRLRGRLTSRLRTGNTAVCAGSARGSARRTESTPTRPHDCTAVSVLAGLRTAGMQHGGPMTARQLPERPNLDQLKRQAKDLLRAAGTHDTD